MTNETSTAEHTRLFMISLQVGDVPATFYREHGAREIAYTQGHIQAGTIRELFMAKDRRTSFLLVSAREEGEVSALIEGFPLRPYLTATVHEVRDLGAEVRSRPSD